MRFLITTLLLAVASLVAASSSDDIANCPKLEELQSCVIPAANDGIDCTTDECTCDAYHRTISCFTTYCPDATIPDQEDQEQLDQVCGASSSDSSAGAALVAPIGLLGGAAAAAAAVWL